MATVVFLWHMHQPYYVHSATRTAMMPWVRLHCVKGYLDMISVLEEYPGVKVNFNLTPVLLLQIQELVGGEVKDLWLEWSRKPAAELNADEKCELLENFFKINWDHLLKPYPRFWELLHKRGLRFDREEVRRVLEYFTTQEFLDLQTWFNLAWCGYSAERLYPELAQLKKKGRQFTEAEKLRVLEIHMEIMGVVVEKYRVAEERGQVELTTTPFFHPILPLVYDSAFAERCLPGRQFPPRFHWPEDAAAQLTLAVEQHRALFGRAPRGLWPSEGSIAPELIPLMARCGIEYFCSDEENLFKSLGQDPSYRGVVVDHLELFQGWRVTHDGDGVNALFREKPLSDFIGFMAAKNDPKQAAEHLLHHLRQIAHVTSGSGAVIPLILDGENAWETFADGGEGFLRALYGGIEAEGLLLHSSTIEEYFRAHRPQKIIHSLHTGSWIGSNFDIWIGEEEENRAWELLGQTRAFLQRQLEAGSLSAEQEREAQLEIYAAEGSDWFWWYGPDFSTENDRLFDELFRLHLQNVYRICSALAPVELDQAITRERLEPLYEWPGSFISPQIDGSDARFYDWIGAGRYLPGREQSAMYRSDRCLGEVAFGNDQECLYLRLNPIRTGPFVLQVLFFEPAGVSLHAGPLNQEKAHAYQVHGPEGAITVRGRLFWGEVIEWAIQLRDLGLKPGAKISFQIRLSEEGVERERIPESSPIQFALLDERFALDRWIV